MRRGARAAGACPACLQRSRLLSALCGPLDYCARDRGRLLDALALDDAELLAALAGTRRAQLQRQLSEASRRETPACGAWAVCRHDERYPRSLLGPSSPRMLFLDAPPRRLARLSSGPVVAVLGSRAPSDHGHEVARALGRELAACGVTVTATLTGGIPLAALAGALQGHGAAIAVLPGGLGAPLPVAPAALLERLGGRGCALAELSPGRAGRVFGAAAAERVVAELGQAALVVEARADERELFGANVARSRGRIVAAVPGRLTSPLSAGPHALIRSGAALVRGTGDVLELLGHRDGESCRQGPAVAGAPPGLRPRLRRLLEQVAGGRDTPERLRGHGGDHEELLLALSELELMGLLARGHGGRYVVTAPAARAGRSPPAAGGPRA